MQFHCSYCGRLNESGHLKAGQKMVCRHCSAEIVVPERQTTAPVPLASEKKKNAANWVGEGFSLRRFLLVAIAVMLGLAGMAMISALLDFPMAAWIGWTEFLTLISLSFYGFTALVGTLVLDRNHLKPLGWGVVILAAIASINVVWTNFGDFDSGMITGRLSFLLISLMLIQTVLLMHLVLRSTVTNGMRVAAIGCGAMSLALALFELNFFGYMGVSFVVWSIILGVLAFVLSVTTYVAHSVAKNIPRLQNEVD